MRERVKLRLRPGFRIPAPTGGPCTWHSPSEIDDQGTARIDHEPEDEPAFQVRVTAACNADSNMSIRRSWGEVDAALVHVPEYSPVLPEIVDLQAPFHD